MQAEAIEIVIVGRKEVKVTPELLKRFWNLVDIKDHPNGCWEWKGFLSKRGYGLFKIKGKSIRANRLSLAFKIGTLPVGMCSCHHCDNPKCVRSDHLFLGSNLDNIADRQAKGRCAHGEAHIRAKLSEQDVREVRIKNLQLRQSIKSLAKEYGVSRPALKSAIVGKTWKHVKD